MTNPSYSPGAADRAPVSFRLAVRNDAPVIHEMVAKLARYLGESNKHTASIADYEQSGFGDNPRFECLIAELAGEPVGMCLYFDSFSTWLGKPGLYVQDLFVSEKARGLKLGKQLLQEVAKRGAQKGYAYIRLSVDVQNENAQGFYEACGFQWSNSERLYVAKGDAFQVLSGAV